ncbi:TetR family transcriptional regulator [Murinocardiopsis flavida]
MTTTSRNTASSAPPQRAGGTGAQRGSGSGEGPLPAEDRCAQAPPPHAPLRRLPAQQRSIARVQRMLDACAELLDENGYAELTTTRIAERASVAIGSVYQFFPDKRAVTQALGLRYLEMFSARVSARLAQESFGHWPDAVDAIIDEYIVMHRTVPGFRSLHFGDVVDVNLLDAGVDNNTVIADRLRELVVNGAGARRGERLDRTVTVAVEAADSVLKLAFRDDPDGDRLFIEEAKVLVRSYLSRHFGAR